MTVIKGSNLFGNVHFREQLEKDLICQTIFSKPLQFFFSEYAIFFAETLLIIHNACTYTDFTQNTSGKLYFMHLQTICIKDTQRIHVTKKYV